MGHTDRVYVARNGVSFFKRKMVRKNIMLLKVSIKTINILNTDFLLVI